MGIFSFLRKTPAAVIGLLLALCLMAWFPETASASSYAANVYDGTKLIGQYATFEEAAAAVPVHGKIYLTKNVTVSQDFLPNVPCTIDGSSFRNAAVIIESESSVDLYLNHRLSLYGIRLKTSSEDGQVTLHGNGHDIHLNDSSVDHIDMSGGTVPASCAFYGDTNVKTVTGAATLHLSDTRLYADCIEAQQLDLYGASTIVFPDLSATSARLHLQTDAGQSSGFITGSGTITVTTDSPQTGSLKEAAILSLQNPGTIPYSEYSRILVPQGLIDPSGSSDTVLTLFGATASGANAPNAFNLYKAVYAKPVSVVCPSTSRTFYRTGDHYSLAALTAQITWEYDEAIFTLDRPFTSGTRFGGPDVASTHYSGAPIAESEQFIDIIWTPGNDSALRCRLAEIKDYAIVETSTRSQNTSLRGSVRFDEASTAALGSQFEVLPQFQGQTRVRKDSSLIYTVQASDGAYAEVTADKCTVTKLNGKQYLLTDFTGDATLKVYYKYLNFQLNYSRDGGTFQYDKSTGVMTFLPNEGYEVKSVTLNGVSLGAVSSVKLTENNSIIKVVFGRVSTDGTVPEVQKPESETTAPDLQNKNERLIQGVKATTIKASSVNVHNGAIRIVWKKSPGYKMDYYQIFRSVKRNSGYGTKPIYVTKTGKATKYTNTKNLKVGTRYYYKVRGVRVIDGKKYYTKWSNKSWRTAK